MSKANVTGLHLCLMQIVNSGKRGSGTRGSGVSSSFRFLMSVPHPSLELATWISQYRAFLVDVRPSSSAQTLFSRKHCEGFFRAKPFREVHRIKYTESSVQSIVHRV